jgi:hypothetical protein
MEDVVYLKNGSIVRGTIIEQIPNQTIKIQTKDQNVFVFKSDEIEKIVKEKSASADTDFQPLKNRFGGYTELNLALGLTSYSEQMVDNFGQNMGTRNVSGGLSFGFKFVGGYRFSENVFAGLGLGLDHFPSQYELSDETSVRFLPLTLDLRTSITKTKRSPVLNLAIGYAFGLDEVTGGLVIHPQMGYQTYLSSKVAYNFSFGYKWQGREVSNSSSYYVSNNNVFKSPSKNITFGFITVNTGFSF